MHNAEWKNALLTALPPTFAASATKSESVGIGRRLEPFTPSSFWRRRSNGKWVSLRQYSWASYCSTWLAFCFTVWVWLRAILNLCECKFIRASLWFDAGAAMLFWWADKWESWDTFWPGACFFVGVGARDVREIRQVLGSNEQIFGVKEQILGRDQTYISDISLKVMWEKQRTNTFSHHRRVKRLNSS
jgi:hypothetical protein